MSLILALEKKNVGELLFLPESLPVPSSWVSRWELLRRGLPRLAGAASLTMWGSSQGLANGYPQGGGREHKGDPPKGCPHPRAP